MAGIPLQGFYNLTEKIRDTLELDVNVNTVTYGDIFEVDLNKQTIFPLSHFQVITATMQQNVWNFSMSLMVMDIVDENKEYAGHNGESAFRGNNNDQDVWNTQLAVANRLLELLYRGDLYVDKYQLEGQPVCEPFVDRFENKLAGWTVMFNVLIPNDMTIC
ncbi:MAG: hypothetical protein Unbinned5607contig1000_22 [Prokaryotic dsDNA virus sp.]|nr:MAG: hypothetical protein Unbinned5607contig1000_22 [Prokaryotic dsDNA virus sp.]|tara:strand:+ start:3052 stop:3534 length:483 start_codon:yes stop_codon:yes gene_type:complete